MNGSRIGRLRPVTYKARVDPAGGGGYGNRTLAVPFRAALIPWTLALGLLATGLLLLGNPACLPPGPQFTRSPNVSAPAVDGNMTPGTAGSSDGMADGPRRPRHNLQSASLLSDGPAAGLGGRPPGPVIAPQVRALSTRHDQTDHLGRVSLRPPRPVFPAWRTLEYSTLGGIYEVETESGRNLKRGDGGKAAGRIQQHRGHWIRGCEWLGVNWPWPADTYDVDKCFNVARANWYRDHRPYVLAGDVNALILRYRRPFDPYTPCNFAYLRKVKAAMKQASGVKK